MPESQIKYSIIIMLNQTANLANLSLTIEIVDIIKPTELLRTSLVEKIEFKVT